MRRLALAALAALTFVSFAPAQDAAPAGSAPAASEAPAGRRGGEGQRGNWQGGARRGGMMDIKDRAMALSYDLNGETKTRTFQVKAADDGALSIVEVDKPGGAVVAGSGDAVQKWALKQLGFVSTGEAAAAPPRPEGLPEPPKVKGPDGSELVYQPMRARGGEGGPAAGPNGEKATKIELFRKGEGGAYESANVMDLTRPRGERGEAGQRMGERMRERAGQAGEEAKKEGEKLEKEAKGEEKKPGSEGTL